MSQDYNATLNLPKTEFPMRAGLAKREPEMLKNWQELDVYNEMLKKNEGKPLFNLHDGPPFSNGALHMGHALNKAIKDFITRSYANSQRFLQEVDASAVMINASTRFNDGGQFGLGMEIGISTSKLHAYGPMGLNELTTQKFVVLGNGETRA